MSNEVPAFGSLHYWFRLKLPMTETIHLYKDKVKAVDYIHSTLSQDTQVANKHLLCSVVMRSNLPVGS